MKMRRLLALGAGALILSGCGGGGSTAKQTDPISSVAQLVPSGNNDFILVGETGIFVRSAPGAVDIPTLIRLTRFPSPVGLLANIPSGLGFLGGADIEQVSAPAQTVLVAPVVLRIPPSTPLPKGRRVLIMVADTQGGQPVFHPLADASGKPTVGVVNTDGRVEFSASRFGSFAMVDDGT